MSIIVCIFEIQIAVFFLRLWQNCMADETAILKYVTKLYCVAFKVFLTVKVYVFDKSGYYSLLYEQVLRGRFCNTVAHIYAYTAVCTFAFVCVAFS